MFGLSRQEIIASTEPLRIVNQERFGKRRIRGVSLDSRKIKDSEIFIAVKGRNFNGHDFLSQAENKNSPFLIAEHIPDKLQGKIKIPVLIVKDTVKALGCLAKSLRLKYSPFVCAVTGSLGKTTVKEMVYHILKDDIGIIKNKASENNHIGVPKTLLGLDKNKKVCVLELGTNHFGEISYLSNISQPTIAVLTCIDDVHLEFFKDKKGVLKEKSSVFRVCPDTLPVLNSDDDLLRRLRVRVKPVYFGSNSADDIRYEFIKQEGKNLLFRINSRYRLKLNSLGWFNIYNAAAALASCVCLGKSLKKSVDCLSGFRFPDKRFQIENIKGVNFINDAYNSSPTALKRALDIIKNIKTPRKIAVLADMLELGDKAETFHNEAIKKLCRDNIDYIIFLGSLMTKAAKTAERKGLFKKDIFLASDLKQAKKQLWKVIRKDDLVFLKGSREFRLEKILETGCKK
jgi:UDP-N-acetylmuramoyl-tripeptide--D-alanyl-D-alanine ligase